MKILYFTTYYDKYLESFYRNHPEFFLLSYQRQLETIMSDYYGVFGSFVNYSNRLGHDAILVIPNCKPMQLKWAQEHGVTYSEQNWNLEISFAQVKAFRPDIFFMSSVFDYYGDFLEKIRPYCGKLFGWISCPIPKGIKIDQLGLILSSVPELVEDFRKAGIGSELLPAAFDPEILKYLPNTLPQDIDFSFIGGFTSAHTKRKLLMEGLIAKTPLNLYGYGLVKDNSLKGRIKSIVKPDPIFKRYKGEVWSLKMYETLRRSKITFNAHIDMALGNRVNMRMYEATGIGTLLLTDKSEENGVEYFVEGKEIVTYTSVEDAIEKVKYYLSHERERKLIADAGQKKTLNNYSYETNVPLMLGYFEKYI